jgi:hypothetical protein
MTQPPPTSHRRLRLAASGGVLLALAGVWLGHTAEYARVFGLTGVREVMAGSLHAYMAPVGMLLALLAALGAVRGVRLWLGLGRQLASLGTALAGALRGDRDAARRPLPGVHAARTPWHPAARVAACWLPLTALQVGLYLFQENLEAVVAGAPAPGLGAVAGAHALAPLLHAGVALVLCAAVALASRLLRRRASAVERAVALLRHLLDRLGSLRPATPGATVPTPAPLDRFGRLWCRPPPARLSL